MTSNPLFFVLLASAAALIPLFLGLFSSYLKISIVLGMLRNALGTQQAPGGLVVMAVSLAITLIIMGPVLRDSAGALGEKNIDKLSKKSLEEISIEVAPAFLPWEKFIRKHAGKRELKAVFDLSGSAFSEHGTADSSGDPSLFPMWAVIPAFVLTELKEAFSMAFILLLPFLVIDLIVSNVLAGMGMTSLSPAMISLPLKLIVFVMADGWLLLAKGLISSYRV